MTEVAGADDAWWDGRQEREAADRQLARVAAELATNAELAREKLEVLTAARDAASKFIGWMGSEPTPVSPEAFSETFRIMYSIGFLRLQRRALDDVRSVGYIDTARHVDQRVPFSDPRLEGRLSNYLIRILIQSPRHRSMRSPPRQSRSTRAR